MILDQPVDNHQDMSKRTDDMLREIGLTIDDCGGNVTFAGAEPVRKTVLKAGSQVEMSKTPQSWDDPTAARTRIVQTGMAAWLNLKIDPDARQVWIKLPLRMEGHHVDLKE